MRLVCIRPDLKQLGGERTAVVILSDGDDTIRFPFPTAEAIMSREH